MVTNAKPRRYADLRTPVERRTYLKRERKIAARRAAVRNAKYADELAAGAIEYADELAMPRPATRAECGDARPCPWVGCRHHMLLEVNPASGEIIFNAAAIEDLPESCSLDVAERGGATLEDIAVLFGDKTRERIRQIETGALELLGEVAASYGIDREDVHAFRTDTMSALAAIADTDRAYRDRERKREYNARWLAKRAAANAETDDKEAA